MFTNLKSKHEVPSSVDKYTSTACRYLVHKALEIINGFNYFKNANLKKTQSFSKLFKIITLTLNNVT